MNQSDKEELPEDAIPQDAVKFEPDLVADGEAEFDYLRIQIRAFEQLKTEFDQLKPYYGYDDYTKRKYEQENDRLVNAIDRRYRDIVDVAQNVFKRKFDDNNKAIIIAKILKLIGGLEPGPQFIDNTDRINVLR